eukprot:gnl/MRDRNA2_/MRDRNA2_85717_c0_seq1.p1 gnl/MRDRNA2_/MRDRNA2_85717_c0~~gnl/MRDRNA2_/MRDRNA2_85717_c0_seq1.p1  ORF type:complete len:498 (-),score=44.06 gnl/MRDRNA2_/MRDRNA2_85717_c0_seq1:2-1495(-)
MSYWYAHITKKYVIILISIIPVYCLHVFCQIGFSYAGGCIATASRTLWDWTVVERPFNLIEVYPYVPMPLDSGCVEWLGFSTCEEIQFMNWMPIWGRSEIDTIYMYNLTSKSATDPTVFTAAELAPLELTKTVSAAGTMSMFGSLTWMRNIGYSYSFDASELKKTISTLMGNQELGTVLSMVYGDITAKTEGIGLSIPLPTSYQTNKIKSLFYYTSSGQDARACTFDDNCGAGCTWDGSCEPHTYGHHPIVMASATFYFDYKPLFELGQWPLLPFKYVFYCIQAQDANCVHENPLPIQVFDHMSFSTRLYYNTEKVDNEKFPDMEFQLWKSTAMVRRDEKCDTATILTGLGHYPGKDCGIPASYAFVAPGVFLSQPQVSSDSPGLDSEIYSERTTGLRFDFLSRWQMNAHVKSGDKEAFVPIYWVATTPGAMVLDEELQFSVLKGYAPEMINVLYSALCVYGITNLLWLYMFFYGSTCVGYMKIKSAQFAPFMPNFI